MSVITEKRSITKTEPLLDVETYKKRYLFGVDLRDGNGDEIEDSVIESYLCAAQDYIEHILEAPIEPQEFTEHLDYKLSEYRTYVYLQLSKYPIVEVDEVNLSFGNGFRIEFPEEWYKVYGKPGQIQLLPTFGTFQRLIFTSSGQVAPSVLYGRYAPQILEVKGKYGIGDDEGRVQPIINQAIGLYASIYMLQMLGDIGPGGPGVSSTSVSMDGLSQSLSTAISATNNLFGASILKYTDMLQKTIIPMLLKHYKRIKLTHI